MVTFGQAVSARARGFTIVELMMTLFVLSILLAIAIPSFTDVQRSGRISAYTGELVTVINEARSRAITARANVFVLQGAGGSPTDVAAVAAGDWSGGWRIVWTNPVSGVNEVLVRNVQSGGGSGAGQVRVVMRNGAVGAGPAFNAGGANIAGIGFSGMGRLLNADGTPLAQAALVVCAPNFASERGRVVAISQLGRLTNNVAANPGC